MITVSLILALDSYLLTVYQINLLSSFQKLSSPEASMPSLLIFVAIFTFIMALFFPATRKIIILLELQTGIYRLFKRESDCYSRNSELSFPSQVKKQAILESDDLLYKEVIAHEAQEDDIETNLNIAFAIMCLLLFNFFLSEDSISQKVLFLIESDTLVFWQRLLVSSFVAVFGLFILFMGMKSLEADREDRIQNPKKYSEKE